MRSLIWSRSNSLGNKVVVTEDGEVDREEIMVEEEIVEDEVEEVVDVEEAEDEVLERREGYSMCDYSHQVVGLQNTYLEGKCWDIRYLL